MVQGLSHLPRTVGKQFGPKSVWERKMSCIPGWCVVKGVEIERVCLLVVDQSLDTIRCVGAPPNKFFVQLGSLGPDSVISSKLALHAQGSGSIQCTDGLAHQRDEQRSQRDPVRCVHLGQVGIHRRHLAR